MIMELKPTDGRKSFYGKATVEITENGTKILTSYDTKNNDDFSEWFNVQTL